jgi:transcriptional regulator GlxA family with amidase domain
MDRKRIGILGYDGVTAINFIGPLEAFANAFACSVEGERLPRYQVVLIGCTGDEFTTDSGVTFRADRFRSEEVKLDTLVIPGGSSLRLDQCIRQKVASMILAKADEVRRFASVCTGIYALAAAGLINGRRVTTHWQYAKDVAEQFPKIRVEESALFLRDGKFCTAAGATAGIDLSLALIAEDFGHQAAVKVAQQLLVYFRRDGGQEQYSEPWAVNQPQLTEMGELHTNRMGELVRWIYQHLGDNLNLNVLAKRALLSKGDFIQQFTATFGIAPGLFVKNLRFNEARRRLLAGAASKSLSNRLGFADAAYFSQEFRRRFGSLPEEYQQRFGVDAQTVNRTKNLAANGKPGAIVAEEHRKLYRRPNIVSFTRCLRRHVAIDEDR